MSLANKTFKNLISGQDITIIDQLGDFVILTNGGKVNINDLMDSNKYIESINPNTFLSSHYDSFKDLAEKIVNTPPNKDIIEATPSANNNYNVSNESAVVISSLDDEKEELARKYGISSNSVTETVSKQNEAFERILNPVKEEPIKKEYQPNTKSIERNQQMEDPIYHIFKNTKKTVDFEFTLTVDGKIPRLDFIEMMEDSYETSIIDFLSKEFTNKVLENPSFLEDQIKSKIREMVYKSKKDVSIKNEEKNVESDKDQEKVEQPLVTKPTKRKYSRKKLNNTADQDN